MAEIRVTNENFKTEVLDADKPVLIDFWATWCGPCQMIGPVVAEIAEEYDGKIKVGKVNIDEQPALAMQYNITAIPALVLFKGGKPAGQIVGFVSKAEIEKLVNA